MPNTVKVAVAQVASVLLDRQASVDKACEWIRQGTAGSI